MWGVEFRDMNHLPAPRLDLEGDEILVVAADEGSLISVGGEEGREAEGRGGEGRGEERRGEEREEVEGGRGGVREG